MPSVLWRVCTDCGDEIGPTDRHWQHHKNGGLIVDLFCEDCMLAQVSAYAERTIAGMLDGQVKVRVIGQAATDGAPSTAERSEP
jgi:hypothetical protein